MELYLLNGEFVAHGDIFACICLLFGALPSPNFYTRIKSTILSVERKCESVGSMCFIN